MINRKAGMKKWLVICGVLLSVIRVQAAIVHKTIEYQHGDTPLEGVLVYDDTWTDDELHPLILVVHQWMGLSDYEIGRAELLAKMGYAAFCADVYGKGVRPKNEQEAAALVDKFKRDRQLLRDRVGAGFWALTKKSRNPQRQYGGGVGGHRLRLWWYGRIGIGSR